MNLEPRPRRDHRLGGGGHIHSEVMKGHVGRTCKVVPAEHGLEYNGSIVVGGKGGISDEAIC
jgi:hypothetical protein